ncbi:hypothetical protein BGZ46_004497 [Entomortierella lignicola]|nr:hypothetical protein BGZ46_004497 [Entomortierella lignicola]
MESAISYLDQYIDDLQSLRQDMKKKDGNMDPQTILSKLDQFNKSLHKLRKTCVMSIEERKDLVEEQQAQEQIQGLMQGLIKQCQNLDLNELGTVIKKIESGLKTCPRWHTFPMNITTRPHLPNASAVIDVCYYMWNDTPVFYTKANIDDGWDELYYEFTKTSDEEIKELPLDIRRFLPEDPMDDVDFDDYKDLSSYEDLDESLWFLWLLGVLSRRSKKRSYDEDPFWDYLKKNVPQRKR